MQTNSHVIAYSDVVAENKILKADCIIHSCVIYVYMGNVRNSGVILLSPSLVSHLMECFSIFPQHIWYMYVAYLSIPQTLISTHTKKWIKKTLFILISLLMEVYRLLNSVNKLTMHEYTPWIQSLYNKVRLK